MLDSCVQCRYGNELVKRTLIGNDFTCDRPLVEESWERRT
jgi:hypothetical protein